MERRKFLGVSTAAILAGCGDTQTDSENSQRNDENESGSLREENNTENTTENNTENTTENTTDETTENTSTEPRNATIESIDVNAGQIDSGDHIEITVVVTLPVVSGVFESDLTITLDQSDSDDKSEKSISVADTASVESVEVSRDVQFETDDLEFGSYQVVVSAAGPDFETITQQGPTVDIVDPYREARAEVQNHIEVCESSIDDAMSTFESYTKDGPTATGNSDYREVEVLRASRSAIDASDAARGYDLEAIGQEGRIDDLEAETQLVRGIARGQTDANDAYNACDDVFSAYTDDVSRVGDSSDYFDDEMTDFRIRIRGSSSDSLENLEENVPSDNTQRNYTQILDEYDSEYNALEGYVPIISEQVYDGEQHLEDARSHFDSQSYNEAEASAERAISSYESAISEFTSIENSAVQNLVDKHTTVIESQINEADELRINAIEEGS